MADVMEIEKIPLRGCGPLSPLYDEALTWAASMHRDQVRKNTRVAYIAHLVAVSSLVLEDGGTETEAIAGLLHDAIEDCGAHVEPILRQRFGGAVVDIVVECSDAAPIGGGPKPPWSIRKQAYVNRFRTTATESALRVSAADKLHNARATLGDLGESEPSGTWMPHNACHHQSLWYYQAISDVITSRLPKSRTGIELPKWSQRCMRKPPPASSNTLRPKNWFRRVSTHYVRLGRPLRDYVVRATAGLPTVWPPGARRHRHLVPSTAGKGIR